MPLFEVSWTEVHVKKVTIDTISAERAKTVFDEMSDKGEDFGRVVDVLVQDVEVKEV